MVHPHILHERLLSHRGHIINLASHEGYFGCVPVLCHQYLASCRLGSTSSRSIASVSLRHAKAVKDGWHYVQGSIGSIQCRTCALQEEKLYARRIRTATFFPHDITSMAFGGFQIKKTIKFCFIHSKRMFTSVSISGIFNFNLSDDMKLESRWRPSNFHESGRNKRW